LILIMVSINMMFPSWYFKAELRVSPKKITTNNNNNYVTV